MALYIPPQPREADEKTPLLPYHSHATADPANKTRNPKARIFFIMGALTLTAMLMWMCYTRLGTSTSLVRDEIGMNGGRGLRFRDDGTFQISVLNDLHFGEAQDTLWGPRQDVKTLEAMHSILSTETPDLVVLNGDLISGEDTHVHNSTAYLDRIVEPLTALNLSWATTYGNHDSDLHLSREALFQAEKKYTGSLTLGWEGRGEGFNYMLPIYGPARDTSTSTSTSAEKGEGREEIRAILWMLDSRGGIQYNPSLPNHPKTGRVGIDAHIHASLATRILHTHASLKRKYGYEIPTLAFFHIPLAPMADAQSASAISKTRNPGLNEDIPGATQALPGSLPIINALNNLPGLLATFSGHDHGNDFCYKWSTLSPSTGIKGKGLNMCFGRHSGYGGYSSWIRGSRQIRLDLAMLEGREAEREVETWTRMEDGSVEGRVVLNGTFGRDGYEPVRLRHTYADGRRGVGFEG